MNKAMGIAPRKQVTSIEIYDKSYHTFYSKGMLSVKEGKFIENFGEKGGTLFKEYFTESWQDEGEDQVGYIHQNMKDAKDETCKAFKIQNDCNKAKILEVIHNEYCKDKSGLTDPAYKLFCSKEEVDQYKFTEADDFTIFTGLTDLETNIDQYIN